MMQYKKEDHRNFLDEIPITYAELISSIESFDEYQPAPKVIRGESSETDAVENWACFQTPNNPVAMVKFVDAFHHYMKINHRIPSVAEFRTHYFTVAKDSIRRFLDAKCAAGADRDKVVSAIFNRCTRTYPSLIRDLEFALLLRDKSGMDVVYNKSLDTDMAIDMMYTGKSGINYGIHLYTKTRRAEQFRAEKDHRHDVRFSNVVDIDYKMDLSSDPIKGIKLYTDRDALMLIAKMREAKLTNQI